MFRDKTIPMIYGGMVFLLSACATAANGGAGDRAEAKGVEQFAGDPRLGEEVSRMCFASSVDSFNSPTDDTVILEVSPSRSFLVETGACFNLDHAQSIALDTTSSCVTRGDNLIVSDSAFGISRSSGIGPDRCFIKSIHAWNADANTDADESEAAES